MKSLTLLIYMRHFFKLQEKFRRDMQDTNINVTVTGFR